MMPLSVDLMVAGVILLVFMADLFMPAEEKRGVAVVAAAGLAITLAATFTLPVGGDIAGGAFVLDPLAMYLKRIFLAAGVLGCIVATDHTDHFFRRRQGEFYILLLSSLLGMTLLASARELMLLVIAFELMSIPLYVLAAIGKGQRSAEAALKLFLVGGVSSVITLYGLTLVYGAAGSTMMSAIATASRTGHPLLLPGLLITLGGLAFKIGLVPFHMWVPDTYEGAPTPFVAFLSVAPKAAGFAALIRLFLEGGLAVKTGWFQAALIMCVATMVLGNVLAIPQTSAKRLLAYSGIGQMGTMFLGLVIVTPDGLAMLLFYLGAYVFTNMGAFAVVGIVEDAAGTDHLDAFKGLIRRNPGLAAAMLVFLLSLAGIPFVAGFWAKLGVFLAAYKAGQVGIVLLGATLAVVGVFYYMRLGRSIFMEEPAAGAQRLQLSLSQKVAVGLACAGVVGMGMVPGPFMESALQAAQVFFK